MAVTTVRRTALGSSGAAGWAVRLGALAMGALVAACVAYDHRWVQNEQEKQRAAKRLAPAKLERRGPGSLPSRRASVRAFATRAHAAETLNWERQFEELLREANAIVTPALGLHLESGGMTLWQSAAPEDQLGVVLDELARHDPGEDAGWVVGLVKSTPELVFDLHQLGVGRVLSKHLVLRASNDPRELELLSHEYYGLGDAEKSKLHAQRKRHRWLVVFLHEIGHTLGARHRVEAGSIMYPRYDPDHRGFDETTLGLLRLTVGVDLGAPSAETYRAVRGYYESHPEGWVPSERQAMLTWLEPLARSASKVPPRTASTAATSAPEPAGLSPLPLTTLGNEDRGRYDAALRAEAGGQFREAWQALAPLIEKHARVTEVQELRCRLAQKQRFFAAVQEAHCEPAAVLGAAVKNAP